jgi:glycosyltransferase involved in cell wall biosynthesis
MLDEGKNGYVFDPYKPRELAEIMLKLIDDPDSIIFMGEQSEKLMSQHTSQEAGKFLVEVTSAILKH